MSPKIIGNFRRPCSQLLPMVMLLARLLEARAPIQYSGAGLLHLCQRLVNEPACIAEGVGNPVPLAYQLRFKLPAFLIFQREGPQFRHVEEGGNHRRLRRKAIRVMPVRPFGRAG